MTHKLIKTNNYLLVVNDSDIKEGDYWHYLDELEKPVMNYLHSTWYDKLHDRNKYKKVIAHLPLNGSPILEGVDLLPPIDDDSLSDLEFNNIDNPSRSGVDKWSYKVGFSEGYNKAREKYKYTEEDMRKALLVKHDGLDADYVIEVISNKYPTEFECEMEVNCTGNNHKGCFMHSPAINCGCLKPKTITTAQGRQWVGKYKYHLVDINGMVNYSGIPNN